MSRAFKDLQWLSILTSGDRVLIAVIALAIGGLYGVELRKEEGTRVMIRSEGDTQLFDMADFAIRSVRGPKGVSEVEVGSLGIRMRTSPCRFQRCVHRGWIRRQGDMIVCIPNRIVMTIQGKRAAVDAVGR